MNNQNITNIICANDDNVCVYQTDSDVHHLNSEELSDLVAWTEAGQFDPKDDQFLPDIIAKLTPGSMIKKLTAHDGTWLRQKCVILQCNAQV